LGLHEVNGVEKPSPKHFTAPPVSNNISNSSKQQKGILSFACFEVQHSRRESFVSCCCQRRLHKTAWGVRDELLTIVHLSDTPSERLEIDFSPLFPSSLASVIRFIISYDYCLSLVRRAELFLMSNSSFSANHYLIRKVILLRSSQLSEECEQLGT